MRVRLLGPVEVDSADGQPGPRDRLVLDALAVRHGQPITAEGLADALWPEGRPASWVKVVQGCVSRLRAVLGPEVIETTGRGYRLVPGRIEIDRDEFEQLLRQGREHLQAGSPERAASSIERALALWRGEPMTELVDWIPGRLEATRLEELRRDAEEDLLQARLDAGRHHDVVSEAIVLAGEQPWRERRWELLALAQYRCGRQRDALASIRTARRALGRELGLDPGSGLVGLEQAILSQDPSLAADHDARATRGSCPWMGLVPYDDEHRDTFFGRREDVEECLRRLDDSALLVLVGPSGCGKSSLMRAGIVPALRARGYDVVVLTPGVDPVASLAAARADGGEGAVLCIDQFEEAFAVATRPGISAWLASIAECTSSRPVVLTLRSDHVAGLVGDPEFAALAERGMHLVVPLVGERLRSSIEGPARVAGLKLEPGLVDLLLRDAADEPGALPLLSHALAETWQQREGTLLTVAGYRATGGISGAVAASADRLHASLSDEGRAQLRWLMLRLAGLADHGEPVRTPMERAIATDDPERAQVVDLLVRARLLTSADGSVELAHESLVRAWPRLRGWLEEDREGQRLWRHLAGASAEWERLGRPDSELYTGVRLAAARDWARREDAQPTRLERSFLDRSVDHAEAEQRTLQQRARHEQRQNRRLRGLLVGVALAMVAAMVAALLALDQGRTAATERDAARESRELAVHEALVSRSLSLRSTNRAAAAILAVEAWKRQGDALSESALVGTFTDAPGFLGYGSTPYDIVQGAPLPGTHRAVIASGNRMHVMDLDTGELGPLFHHAVADNDNQQVLRVSGDGRRVAQLLFDPAQMDTCGHYERLVVDDGRGCTLLTVLDIETRRPVFGPVPTPFSGGDLAIDHSGSTVAVTGGFDGDLATYDVERGTRLGTLSGLPRPDDAFNWRDTGAVAFDGQGRLYLGSMNGPVRIVDPETLQVRRRYEAPPRSTHNFLTVTPGGLLVGTGDESIVAIRATTGREVWRVDLRDDPEAWPCQAAAVAAELGLLFCGSLYGEIEERSLRTGQLTGVRRDRQLGEVGDLAIAHDNELVSFSAGIQRWRLDGSGPVSRLIAPGAFTDAGYDDSGRLLDLVATGSYGPHRVIDLETGSRVDMLEVEGEATWVGEGVMALLGDWGLELGTVGPGLTQPEDPVLRRAESVFPGYTTDRAWAATHVPGHAGSVLHEFDVASATTTGRVVRVPGDPTQLRSTDAGRTLLVGYLTSSTPLSYGNGDHYRAALFRVRGGRSRDVPAYASAVAETDGGIGRIVVADTLGRMEELDPTTMEPTAVLPGSVGIAHWLAFDDDGSRLLATGGNSTVHLYDAASWTRVGSIPAEGSDLPLTPAFLHPDGRSLVANSHYGVVEWTLEPETLAEEACGLAGRNLTRAEWATYFGDEAYRRTCPQFPVGA